MQTWADNDPSKPVSAARMNHIESGIDAVANGGSLPAITISPVTNGVSGIVIKDASANVIYEVENIGLNSSHYAPTIVFSSSYGRAGSGGRVWSFGVDTAAATPYRDWFLSKVGGIDGSGSASTVYDFFYINHRGTSPPTLSVGNSSFTPVGQVELIMAADGSGNVIDTTLHNLRIHTALITGGSPSNQTLPAISVANWTSGTDRFHVECDGGLLINDSGGSQLFKVDGSNNGNTAIKGVLNIGSDASGTSHNLFVKNGTNNTDISIQTDAGGSFQIQCLNASGTVNLWSTNNSNLIIGTNGVSRIQINKNAALSGSVNDFTIASVTGGTGTGAFTIARFNYWELLNPTGSATVTDAAVFQFDAAAGTHKALDGATTKTTPSGVDAWMKINVNGTLYYVPAYVSKTA